MTSTLGSSGGGWSGPRSSNGGAAAKLLLDAGIATNVGGSTAGGGSITSTASGGMAGGGSMTRGMVATTAACARAASASAARFAWRAWMRALMMSRLSTDEMSSRIVESLPSSTASSTPEVGWPPSTGSIGNAASGDEARNGCGGASIGASMGGVMDGLTGGPGPGTDAPSETPGGVDAAGPMPQIACCIPMGGASVIATLGA